MQELLIISLHMKVGYIHGKHWERLDVVRGENSSKELYFLCLFYIINLRILSLISLFCMSLMQRKFKKKNWRRYAKTSQIRKIFGEENK